MGTQPQRVFPWRSLVVGNKMVLLMLGGALGTYARYTVGRWISSQPWAQGFPFGTLVVNVIGSFLLAVTAVVVLELFAEHQDWYLLLGTGFCGGFTTFSTFEWETFKLVREGSWVAALLNVFGSVVAGFVGVLLGVALVMLLFSRR
ncbi:MAG: fluoride efflux transporter CrcB [Gemmataceae bacterium]|nr:fluoride efflux transporter CrcB [Gemmataceae bacterium]MDW8267456.1 fluoride efflux transporter CrcB [Gemmataceae bacterium]